MSEGLPNITVTLLLILAAGLLATVASAVLRLPRVLVLLVVGICLGPSVLDLVNLPLSSRPSQLILTLGVSLILFHGGMQLSLRQLRKVYLTLSLLVLPGVLITALVVGAAASAAFGLPLAVGLTVGAALAPTDPAILVPLFERMRLRPKLFQTIIAEAGFNDPVGAVMALAFAGIAVSGNLSLLAPVGEFVKEMAIATVGGIVVGAVLAFTISTHRAALWSESATVAVLCAVVGTYAFVYSAGGSGYLGAFVAGVIVANMADGRLGRSERSEREMRTVVATLADIVTIGVFVILGSGLPLGMLAHGVVPALVVIGVLVLLARPAVVVAATALDRRSKWTWQETAFLAWTRETGVMPAALAAIAGSQGIPGADVLAICVALAVIVTLVVQASTKAWLAKQLGLVGPGPCTAQPAGRTTMRARFAGCAIRKGAISAGERVDAS